MNNGSTPLLNASHNGHLEVVRELLARGASPGLTAHNGTTSLSAATAHGHPAPSCCARHLWIRFSRAEKKRSG